VLISNLEKRRPKIVLRDAKGFYLAKAVRDDFAERYASITSGVKIVQLLANLPNDIPNLIERGFLNEVLTCFKCGAHRSAIVMAWNLAYVHLCEFVFANHLVTFNLKWPARHPGAHAKSKVKEIAQREHFSELKESEVLEICRSAGIISADLYRLLEQKLGTRNSAAHPSNIVFTQLQAEEFIHSIVSNVVTQLV